MRLEYASTEEDAQTNVLTRCPAGVTVVDVNKGHVLVNGNEGGVFDTVPQEAHGKIEPVECKRWIDPRRSVDGVVTDCDKESHEAEDATAHVSKSIQAVLLKRHTVQSKTLDTRISSPVSSLSGPRDPTEKTRPLRMSPSAGPG